MTAYRESDEEGKCMIKLFPGIQSYCLESTLKLFSVNTPGSALNLFSHCAHQDQLARHFTSLPAFSLVHTLYQIGLLSNTQLASWATWSEFWLVHKGFNWHLASGPLLRENDGNHSCSSQLIILSTCAIGNFKFPCHCTEDITMFTLGH